MSAEIKIKIKVCPNCGETPTAHAPIDARDRLPCPLRREDVLQSIAFGAALLKYGPQQ